MKVQIWKLLRFWINRKTKWRNGASYLSSDVCPRIYISLYKRSLQSRTKRATQNRKRSGLSFIQSFIATFHGQATFFKIIWKLRWRIAEKTPRSSQRIKSFHSFFLGLGSNQQAAIMTRKKTLTYVENRDRRIRGTFFCINLISHLVNVVLLNQS